nr:integrator complex subunit 7 [Leptinotarsa decemlineata]
MIGVRVSAFNENGLGEPDQDANSALTELDKGLRSAKVGEQCEAIVRFPKLFEKFPFPILINASLLRLSDVFRIGNNFLRLCVLRVCIQSEKHLDKISNVDEFVKRVYSVIHSNDPIARAVTLRIFGAVAAIIPERQQIHHCIRSSLDSHDSVEVEAAVYAAIQFAAQSKLFAISMCNKVSDMIQGQSTPANMKLQLIPILQYMHHDTNTAAMVRSLCIELLPGYPAQEFVLVTLNTLTKLAATTLVDIPSQIHLLLKYLKNDPRWEVKSKALQHLYELAKPGAHLWPPGSVEDIIDYVLSSNQKKILLPALRVLQVLVESPRMCHEHRSSGSKLRELCSNHCYSPEPGVAAQSIQILTQILCYCYKENLETDGVDEVIAALETLVLLLTFISDKHPTQLKLVLKCAVRLCEARQQYCEVFVELLGTRLDNIDRGLFFDLSRAFDTIKHEYLPTKLEAIGIRGPVQQWILSYISRRTLEVQIEDEFSDNFDITIGTPQGGVLGPLLFLLYVNDLPTHIKHGQTFIYADDTTVIVVADTATEFQKKIKLVGAIGSLKPETVLPLVDPILNLLTALSEVPNPTQHQTHTKTMLCTLIFQTLSGYKWNEVTFNTILKVVSSNNLWANYCIARAAVRYGHHRVAHHIFSGLTEQVSSEHFHFWLVCLKEMSQAEAQLYSEETESLVSRLDKAIFHYNKAIAALKVILYFVSEVIVLNRLLTSYSNELKGSKKLNIELQKQVEILKKIVELLANASLPIPKYFFQVLQSTSVKLAISPQPRVLGEFISVQAGSQLAVKVEGVIQHGMKPGLFRRIEEVVITVTSQLQNNPKNKEVLDPKLLEQVSVLTQTVTPHKDFFRAQFLLAFPRGGQYLLVVEASVIDERSNTWKTGPRSTLTVKVPEETKLAPIAVPGMASNANVILMPEDSLFVRPQQKKST